VGLSGTANGGSRRLVDLSAALCRSGVADNGTDILGIRRRRIVNIHYQPYRRGATLSGIREDAVFRTVLAVAAGIEVGADGIILKDLDYENNYVGWGEVPVGF
jgi:hypothetical protein